MPSSVVDSSELTAVMYLVRATQKGWCDMYALDESQAVSIGRGSRNDIALRDSRCSRAHCELRWQNGDWYVFDNGSCNGTWVNDDEVHKVARLQSGDTLQIGKSEFRLTTRDELLMADASADESSQDMSASADPFDGTTLPPQRG